MSITCALTKAGSKILCNLIIRSSLENRDAHSVTHSQDVGSRLTMMVLLFSHLASY